MDSSHSILVSVDDETHRRAQIRADQLQLSIPEFAASALASAVETVDLTKVAPEEDRLSDLSNLDDLIGRIRAAHPDFRASDNLPREQLYERAVRSGS